MEPSEAESKSLLIIQKLIELVDWHTIKTAHIYRSVAEWNEVDTNALIDFIHSRLPNISVSVPSSDMDHEIDATPFNLVIVPVLGFDKTKNRLGMGGGYYDRFLAAQHEALKIGLAYAQSEVLQGIPHESHDIPLDKIITESIII